MSKSNKPARTSIWIICPTLPKQDIATVYTLEDFIEYWELEQFDLSKCVIYRSTETNPLLQAEGKEWISGKLEKIAA